ncbi:MAG: beta-lactamase [Candidatus Xenobia bacterium]|jgi:D-alanyl-D-alanine carboxypeptidase
MQQTRRDFLMTMVGAGLLAGCGGTEVASVPPDNPPVVNSPLDEATLNRTLDEQFAVLDAPGVIAGVWVGGQSWTALRGVQDTLTRTPVTMNLHTRVGSVTKTLTGTLILQLVGEGLLGLDESIERWFPELPDARAITIRDLGSMSSGIDSYTLDPKVADEYLSNPTRAWSPQELVAAGASLPRKFPPGLGFQYSNTNFVMLGLIVESLRGKPIAQVLKERIFARLGMEQSSYPLDTRLPDPHWSGYTLQGSADNLPLDATEWSPTFASTAGEMVSTLEDLRIWTRVLGTGSLLSPALQAERLKPNLASQAGGRAYLFALGREPGGWLAHDGEIPGFNTQIAYLPSLDATIVVMVNCDIGKAPAAQIFAALASIIAPEA